MGTVEFQRGDVVRLARNGGDAEVVLLSSYAEQFGGNNHRSFTVADTTTGSEWSWAEVGHMTLVRRGGEAEVERVRAIRDARLAQERDIDWIIARWRETPGRLPGASVHALAALVGLTDDDVWGPRGEGIDWYHNAMRIMWLFSDALDSGRVDAVHARAAAIKEARRL